MTTRPLDDLRATDTAIAGGKGASLGEMTDADLPVPPGFVVVADTYRRFIDETGIADDLFAAVDVDPEDGDALREAAERARTLVSETPVPDDIAEAILESYDALGGEPFVAVRSSATAEDLPDASFAGQQETFLNCTREDLVDRVQDCWASLFTRRAIYYRQKQGFDHDVVNIAVVVQEMVDAEKSGVLFTRDPSTGEARMIVESAWGLGEGVVSGSVTPDNYVVDRTTGTVEEVTVATKRQRMRRDPDTGETVTEAVPQSLQNERVLDEDELAALHDLAATVEDHYGTPQDVEWAIADDEIYLLQSRPITTIDDAAEAAATEAAETTDDEREAETSVSDVGPADGVTDVSTPTDGGANAEQDEFELLTKGHGASPGTASGTARIVKTIDQIDKVEEGDVLVTEMTTPDMVPAMQRAVGIVTSEGGLTSHASIISRELGVPAVVGTGDALDVIDDGDAVALDGDKGTVTPGQPTEPEPQTTDETAEDVAASANAADPEPIKPMTATEVKVNISIPAAAERAAATGADGVGLLRLEHMVVDTGRTPRDIIERDGPEAYVDELVSGVYQVADAFYPRPVRVRTLDAPTDEFRQLAGGEHEPEEHNPMLGYRGVRRSLEEPDVFQHELAAFRKLYDMGYTNVELMLPLVNDAEDVERAKALMREAGIDPEHRKWGVMIETPAAALCVEELCEAGVDFVSFGTNDLTQYTLAVDRNNELVADRYDALHPAVLRLVGDVIDTCREYDVETSICGQAGSEPEMVQFLAKRGVTSISANVDAVRDVQHRAKRVEQRILLDSVR